MDEALKIQSDETWEPIEANKAPQTDNTEDINNKAIKVWAQIYKLWLQVLIEVKYSPVPVVLL